MEKTDRPLHRKPRKKICHFCADRVEAIDYKDVSRLRKDFAAQSDRHLCTPSA